MEDKPQVAYRVFMRGGLKWGKSVSLFSEPLWLGQLRMGYTAI